MIWLWATAGLLVFFGVLRQSLPAGVIPAYDGMRLELG